MFQGDSNSYTNNSGNSYNYMYVTNTFDHSFNTTHSNSHNGHGRGGWCGVIALLVLVGIPVAVIWFIGSILSEVLR